MDASSGAFFGIGPILPHLVGPTPMITVKLAETHRADRARRHRLTSRMAERWTPSVTVAAIIERRIDGASRFLLVEEETPEGLKLNNPAGHLEPGESPLQGVVREALEETACVFTPDRLIGVYLSRFTRPARGEDVTYLRFAFGGSVGEPDPARTLDAGIVRTLWLTLAEVRASVERHRSPNVLRCVEDFVAGRRYPLDAVSTDASVYTPEIKR
jgi:8-oxo-dGTP pyrophosphatase MutT (NUDIX family)